MLVEPESAPGARPEASSHRCQIRILKDLRAERAGRAFGVLTGARTLAGLVGVPLECRLRQRSSRPRVAPTAWAVPPRPGFGPLRRGRCPRSC